MSITSPTLFALVAFMAVALPVGLVAARMRMQRTWVRGLVSWVAIVVAQVLAIAAVGLHVNREYGFYASWADAMGEQQVGPAAISAGGVSADDAGEGSLQTFDIGVPRGGKAQAIAWLPPGYAAKENAKRHYPVLVVLPGYANTVGSTMQNLNFGATASQLITSHAVAPFIAVFAPYQTVQGRDTECTDIHDGAQELTFLTRNVPAAIRTHVRAAKDSQQWSALGWSTGGYCAAKALYVHSGSPWGSAVSMGGYFEAFDDGTTRHLYPNQGARDANSPSHLYRQYQMPTTRLLIVSSRHDTDAWKSSSAMAKLAAADPHVASMWLASGGHNYGTYTPHLGEMITWAFSPDRT